MNFSAKSLAFLMVIFLFSQCQKEEQQQEQNPEEEEEQQQTGCDNTRLPVVMAHGFLASGDTYAKHFMRFTSNSYCPERLFAYDWNTLGGGGDVALLNAFIDDVLAKTGAAKVHLMGHSAGGGLGYNYLSDPVRAAKVARYVHIGSGSQPAPAGPNGEIPTLNLWSDGDVVVAGADITGATNVMLSAQDHYQVATSAESFQAIYKFLNDGQEPQTLEIVAETVPCISGKAITFGENNPIAGGTVKIFEVNASTGERLSSTADTTLPVDAKGGWGPVVVKPGSYYEFEVQSARSGDRVIHYYREPAVRTNAFVYLRTLPPPGSLASLLLASLPNNDNQAVLAVFSSSQAVINGRDVLTAAGVELSTAQLAPASQTAIAFFLYDNGDSQTSGNPLGGLFGSFPFLAGADVYFPTSPPGTIQLELNGRTLNVRNWRSASDGLVVPVFD